jgi:hypothetical protein
MAEHRRRIWQISLTAVFFALGLLVVIRYDDLPLRIFGIAAVATVAYAFWEGMNHWGNRP